ncbi:hypothetical protein H6F88_01865 [Oculatella sp. FACHB-28]|uniref:ribonuclease toxin HepT-like protein n=1 Tax=Cyanophyceae TaxID=3028117 RepID=UPI0016880CEF|nr:MULTISPECIES: hypothetical protein [Cyanophyceae]MBD2054781.1 hypothetical protein [Oculatella sp. FACHB-28]MBD2072308.1 hypothetical protein [Leptolyngbya sp. FACHB-671]
MEARNLAVFTADITAQQQAIERVFAMLEQRAEGLKPDYPERLESVAYQLHNFYGAIEELLKIVATYFENNVSDTARWHSLLLLRMTQAVEGVRPAAISTESYALLNALRAFRHFFRHAYGVPIDFAQLQSNLTKAQQLKPLLDRDLKCFLQDLRGLSN